MPFFKNVDIKDAESKYGFSHQGVFAKEPIRKHEAIWRCDLTVCDYLKIEEIASGRTRAESLRLMSDVTASQRDFLHKYSYMIDDDTFDFPRKWRELALCEECMYFNHSCDPNCGFMADDASLVVAIRDIDVGEELCYDYQCMDTEPSFYDGLSCLCGSFKCRGILRFDQYRNVDWQNAYYKYSGLYVKRKIDELKTKWYSSRCYLRHYYDDREHEDKENRVLGLTSLRKIRKDDLVAQFASEVSPNAHYIRHSNTPTCYLDEGKQVFAAANIEPDTELTLNYNNLN